MYLRKISPSTTCLYSAASMLLRSLSAASQSVASKPTLAPLPPAADWSALLRRALGASAAPLSAEGSFFAHFAIVAPGGLASSHAAAGRGPDRQRAILRCRWERFQQMGRDAARNGQGPDKACGMKGFGGQPQRGLLGGGLNTEPRARGGFKLTC